MATKVYSQTINNGYMFGVLNVAFIDTLRLQGVFCGIETSVSNYLDVKSITERYLFNGKMYTITSEGSKYAESELRLNWW